MCSNLQRGETSGHHAAYQPSGRGSGIAALLLLGASQCSAAVGHWLWMQHVCLGITSTAQLTCSYHHHVSTKVQAGCSIGISHKCHQLLPQAHQLIRCEWAALSSSPLGQLQLILQVTDLLLQAPYDGLRINLLIDTHLCKQAA